MNIVIRPKKYFDSRLTRAILNGSRHRGRGFILLLAVVMIGLQGPPEVQRLMQYDRNLIEAGQYWRTLTCHFVHWSWVHVAYDVGMFVGLSWMVAERRKVFYVTLFSCLAGSLALYCCNDDITLYRGISGVNYAILVMLLINKSYI